MVRIKSRVLYVATGLVLLSIMLGVAIFAFPEMLLKNAHEYYLFIFLSILFASVGSWFAYTEYEKTRNDRKLFGFIMITMNSLLHCCGKQLLHYFTINDKIRSSMSDIKEQHALLTILNQQLEITNKSLVSEIERRKQVERQKIEAAQRAERLERLASLGLLTSSISHEINQPLNAIKVTTDSLLLWQEQGKTIESEDYENALVVVKKGVERIHNIVNSVRHLAAADLHTSEHKMDIKKTVKYCIDELQPMIIRKGIGISVDISENLFVAVKPTRGFQMINHLLLNSIDACASVTVARKEIHITAFRKKNEIVMEVQDTGCGIPDDLKDKVFEPFFTTKPVGQGMGMGLTLVHAMVSAYSGTIMIDSELGRGTVVRVALPRIDSVIKEENYKDCLR